MPAERFLNRERKGPAWVRACIAGLERTIKRYEAAENPNAIYLRSLETLLQAYRDGKIDR
jgi:hypothetical protein